MAEWLYRWLNENPTATIEEGLKAFGLSKDDASASFDEISDEEIDKAAQGHFSGDTMWSERIAFKLAIKWYREQLKSRQ